MLHCNTDETEYKLKSHLRWHIPLLNKVSSRSQLLRITSLKFERKNDITYKNINTKLQPIQCLKQFNYYWLIKCIVYVFKHLYYTYTYLYLDDSRSS